MHHASIHVCIPPAKPLGIVSLYCGDVPQLLIEATDRDDTDLQLWRLISRLCVSLGSKRLARYCLEAALETDDGNYDLWPEPQFHRRCNRNTERSMNAEQMQSADRESSRDAQRQRDNDSRRQKDSRIKNK